MELRTAAWLVVGFTCLWLPGYKRTDFLVDYCHGANCQTKGDAVGGSDAGGDVGADDSGGDPTAHPATHLAFTRQPWNPAAIDRELSVQVSILDATGNPVADGPDATSDITLTLTAGTGPLQGTLTAATLAGSADFTGHGVSLPAKGVGFVITATKPDTSAMGGTGVMSVCSTTRVG